MIAMNPITAYFDRITNALSKTETEILYEIAEKIMHTKQAGARIFTAGNGGSAATASHFCNDLIKGCRVDNRTGFKAHCLADPVPVTTCLGNDFGYDEIFATQLQTHAQKNDLLILFSGSGNSPNIIKAAMFAKNRGMPVIGFGGRDGGEMAKLCELCLIAPTESMEELEDLHLVYCHALVEYIRGQLKDRWDMEIIHYPKRPFLYALFDFDGTVSLLREGWREVMIPYFVEELLKTPHASDVEELTETVAEFVDLLTGKQTIFQCMKLDEEIQKRGGPKNGPHVYKTEYLRRLTAHTAARHENLRNGGAVENYLVPGVISFLEKLKENGVTCYLASGTDEADVIAEAELLGLAKYFGGGIYGARDSVLDCSKELVIKQILSENNITGPDLISFGDGYIEVELVHTIGGFTIAVATDEEKRKGVNAWKRKRLLSAGADVVIPDFSDAGRLFNFIVNI
jgi:phosphoheptose isomerase/phosphoglycolate phosphatase-like HAD superfamily hydrolase